MRSMEKTFAATSNFRQLMATSRNKKRLLFGLFVSVLLIAVVVSIVAVGVSSRKNSTSTINEAHTILKSSCSSTLYPDVCFSAVSALPEATSKIKSKMDVIQLSLNATIAAVQQNYLTFKNLSSTLKNLTKREKIGFQDCMEMANDTLDKIYKVEQGLREYKSLNKSISRQADDLNILLSAAITDQDTCLDSFSKDEADKKVLQLFIASELHVSRLCSNVLAMVKNMTDTDMAEKNFSSSHRKLEEEYMGAKWPEWLLAADRRLLQASDVTPSVVVAADGSGNYRTVSEAVAAAPQRSSSRYIIRIKAGVYRENVEVRKTNIMFLGDGRTTTTITGNRNVVDGSTTFHSATVAAVGGGFLARDITFKNTAGPSKHQAVALRVGSDLSAFYRCGMLAYQNTLYVHSSRQFYVSCYIAGTIDFIFGNAAAVFQNCDIHARLPNPNQRNMVTAQGRNDPNENTGIVIQNCRIGATPDLLQTTRRVPSYLGRPWKEYSRTVKIQIEISSIIQPAGWHEWAGNFALDTLFYAEYGNTGPGADTSNRVQWKGFRVLGNAAEAQAFTAGNFISGVIGYLLPVFLTPSALGPDSARNLYVVLE